jgi:hypothetical protein
MSRQPGEPMRKLLALHIEWLKANGYPVKNIQSTSEKKKKEKKKKPLAINLKIII